MTHPGNISIQDYTYELPVEKIALHPLPIRDVSKLLIYNKGKLKEDIYHNIDQYLPPNTLLIFNNTRVINARLRFKKNTGAIIEILCLEPAELINEYTSLMSKRENVKWKCFVGGASKWKEGALEKKFVIKGTEIILKATLVEKLKDAYIISFSWMPADITFAEILEETGDIPLPPYIKRTTDLEDMDRYQTIYAAHDGSVAAPTAGLHFTENIFEKLKQKNIHTEYVTLHVGAGTFKPVKALNMQQHEMHAEWIDVDIETIKAIKENLGHIVAVGTTSLRTLETIYWLGVKIMLRPAINEIHLFQWDVYEEDLSSAAILPALALEVLLQRMKERQLKKIFCQTQLLIAPGYEFKMVKALITNFHQPQSTLLLLVAAAVGNDWKKIYDHALQNNYRFLSYGDGNLIFIN